MINTAHKANMYQMDLFGTGGYEDGIAGTHYAPRGSKEAD